MRNDSCWPISEVGERLSYFVPRVKHAQAKWSIAVSTLAVSMQAPYDAATN
jgi:hypothetical protein